jgi:transcriptional regulator with XRE-family HTH domain
MRVRRIRETAGLSIQEACDRGGISANFWGRVERAEQKPCLLSICGMAQGLGVFLQILMSLEKGPSDNNLRSQMNDVLDLCNADQWELRLRIMGAIYEHGTASTTSRDTANQ